MYTHQMRRIRTNTRENVEIDRLFGPHTQKNKIIRLIASLNHLVLNGMKLKLTFHVYLSNFCTSSTSSYYFIVTVDVDLT